MSVLTAVRIVLQDADGPLHYREITRRILERGLWTTTGKTPQATVNARLWESIGSDSGSPFTSHGKGVFGLTPPTEIEPAPAAPPISKGPTVSFTSAAEHVLKAHGSPLHYRDITQRSLAQGLVATAGKTPEASFYTSIYEEIKRQKERGDVPRFALLGKGLVSLTAWQAPGLVAQVEAHNDAVRAALLARLKTMDPVAFESLVGRLLEALGFAASVTKASGDGGIDVRGTLVVGGTIRTRMAVQVKRWKANVQAPTVQQVRGSVGAHEQGMIITTGGFSKGAREEAAQPDKAPVALMDGDQLARLLMEHDIGVTRHPLVLHDLAPADDEAPLNLGPF